jgi:hypothetical protein
MSKRANLTQQGPTVFELAPGLYEINFAIINDGLMPTKTQIATQNRATHPTIVRISTPVEQIVSGDRVARVWNIAGAGGRETYQWIVRAQPGSDITIEVLNILGADQKHTFKAQATTPPAREGGAP